MPSQKDFTNITAQQAIDGIDLSNLGGGAGPSVAVIFASVDDVVPADCETCSIQEFPGSKFAVGANGGSIAVIATLTNNGDDTHFNVAGGGTVILPDGFWGGKLRSIPACDNIDFVRCSFTVQWLAHDIFNSSEFPNDLVDTTTKPAVTIKPADPVTENKTAEVTFSYPNTSAENPTSIAVVRRHNGLREVIGSIAWVGGKTDYVYTDKSITDVGSYEYTLAPYKLPTSAVGPESLSTTIAFDIDIDSSGGIDVGYELVSRVVILADPSGIYTFVPDKTHDTLINRPNGIVEYVDIEIPEPIANILL